MSERASPLQSFLSLAADLAADRAERDAAEFAADRARRVAELGAGYAAASALFREARQCLDRLLLPAGPRTDAPREPGDLDPLFARPYDAPLAGYFAKVAESLSLIGAAVRAHDGIPAVRAAAGYRFAPHFESGECLPLDPARDTPADRVGRLRRVTDPAVRDLLLPPARLAIELVLDAASSPSTAALEALAYRVAYVDGGRASLGWLPLLVAMLDQSESLGHLVGVWGPGPMPDGGWRWERQFNAVAGLCVRRVAWLAAGADDAEHLFPALSARGEESPPESGVVTPPVPVETDPGGMGTAPDAMGRADGIEGGRWLWFGGVRRDVPTGVVCRLIAHMWSRDHAAYDSLFGGVVFDEAVQPQTVRARASEVSRLLAKIGVPWCLEADSTARMLRKLQTKIRP